jgi:starch-binding outer membrane protein, SusD/RagB family
MKRSIIYIFIIGISFGCSEDFLDLAPISSSNVQNFYRTMSDFETAIVGAYSSLRLSGTYHDHMQLVGDLRSDNTEMGTTASVRFPYFELSEFRDQVTNSINESIWNHHYLGISRVNRILDNISNLDASDAYKTRIEGESKFLRALLYFNLVRVFGDVPLLTSRLRSIEDAYSRGRTEKSLVYEQIIKDLVFAENSLPVSVASNQVGRATKGAASSLLGKVYLTLKDFSNAKTKLENVINSNQYQLLDNYATLWSPQNKNHNESIFDVQFRRGSGTSTGSNFSVRFTPYLYTNLPFYSTGGGYNIPTDDLINAYEEGDLRKNSSLREYYINNLGNIVDGLEGRYSIKFYNMPTQGQGADDNWPVIRYADVLLMYAEVLNEISFQPNGQAFTYLNMVRKRAGLPDKTSGNANPKLSVDSQAEFRLAIEHERRVELAFEGHRWFDLVRTGRAITVLNPKVNTELKEHHLLLPIPQTQIDINPDKISQNPGYDI